MPSLELKLLKSHLAEGDCEGREDHGDGAGQTSQGEEGQQGRLELPDCGLDQDTEGHLEAGGEEGHQEPRQEDDAAPAALRVILPEHDGALHLPLHHPGLRLLSPLLVVRHSGGRPGLRLGLVYGGETPGHVWPT